MEQDQYMMGPPSRKDGPILTLCYSLVPSSTAILHNLLLGYN